MASLCRLIIQGRTASLYRLVLRGCTASHCLTNTYPLCWIGCWLCWGLTSQSTIFQSCRDGAIASWVINQYFRGVKCLAQGHNTAAVGLEPRTSRSGVRHSTTEPPRSPPIMLEAYVSPSLTSALLVSVLRISPCIRSTHTYFNPICVLKVWCV